MKKTSDVGVLNGYLIKRGKMDLRYLGFNGNQFYESVQGDSEIERSLMRFL